MRLKLQDNSLTRTAVIYNLSDGKLVCQIDLEPAGFSSGTSGGGDDATTTPWQPWTASPALDRLVWLDPQGTIFSLDLEHYVRSKPQVVTLPDDSPHGRSPGGGVSQGARTCRRGGSSWKQALVDQHRREMDRSASRPWSRQTLATSAPGRRGATPSKIPACGFRGKGSGVLAPPGGGDDYLKRLRSPSGSLLKVGYRVSEVRCSRSALAMVLVSSVDESQSAVCLVDLKSEQVYFHR